jgi:hypothetical protein
MLRPQFIFGNGIIKSEPVIWLTAEPDGYMLPLWLRRINAKAGLVLLVPKGHFTCMVAK